MKKLRRANPLYLAFMLAFPRLGVLVVVDAHEYNVALMVSQGSRIVSLFNPRTD